jgi:16S rRNA processing protein RimM
MGTTDRPASPQPVQPVQVVVGRIGRAHGIRGEVSVEPRTDEPERRFAEGALLGLRTPDGELPHGRPGRLRVRSWRRHQSRLLVGFVEIADRTAADGLHGLSLVAQVDPDERPEDPEEFYDHQLVGLEVLTIEGASVGTVVEVLHGGDQDLLAVRTTDGGEALVPFVAALVPVVDVAAGRLEVADRPGLLSPLDEE